MIKYIGRFQDFKIYYKVELNGIHMQHNGLKTYVNIRLSIGNLRL
jgi:lantibiotic modifying enzyme